MNPKQKKTVIYTVIIVACLIAAASSYMLLSDNSPPVTPQAKAAQARADEIQKGMESQPGAKQPEPPKATAAHRGAVLPTK